MDIDSALNELGMLSTVTNSRRQFLSEQKRVSSDPGRKDQAVSPGPSRFQVLQLDPKYVTGFSVESKPQQVWIPINPPEDSGRTSACVPVLPSDVRQENSDFGMKYREMTSSEEVSQNRRKLVRMSRMRAGRYKRYQKPYEVPWRLNQSFPETDLRVVEKNEFSQPKSNTSSPVKPSIVTRLTRSRSLGNLDFTKLHITDFRDKVGTEEREEMEKVSVHLQNLHVNDV